MPRSQVLPHQVQQRIMNLTTSSNVIAIKDFDDKVGFSISGRHIL